MNIKLKFKFNSQESPNQVNIVNQIVTAVYDLLNPVDVISEEERLVKNTARVKQLIEERKKQTI